MHPVIERLRGVLSRRPWLAPTAFAVLAGVVLLVRLGQPDRIMFDETYYVDDAIGYLDAGIEPSFAVHPPLGKWLIAASIALLGDDPVGWRMAGALAGVAIVVLTHLLARRLLRGTRSGWWLALLAPVLLLADGLFLTQARIAMLDIHLVLFAVAGLYVLMVDRDRRRATPGPQPRLLSWRMLAGVLFGCAIAVKWSGLLALGATGLLTIGWEFAAARGHRWYVLPARAMAVVGSLVVVPAVVYAVTWVPWLIGYDGSYADDCPDGETCETRVGERIVGLLDHHDQMLNFHLTLEATHNYRSDPLGWVVLERPVVYYWETCSEERAAASPSATDEETGDPVEPCEVAIGDAAEVIALGNPALWWGWILLLPLLVAGTVLRDRRAAVPLVWWLATWLPWLAVSRTAFVFYLAPTVPLIAVGTVVALQRLGDPTPVRRFYLGALGGAGLGLMAAGALHLVGVLEGVRVLAALAGLGWALGAGVGAIAQRRRSAHTTAAALAGPTQAWPAPAWTTAVDDGDPVAADQAAADRERSSAGRWALLAVTLVVGVGLWFLPVWYALPLDAGTVRDRWWFDTWI